MTESIGMEPVQVEVVSQTAWWLPWLPVFGSLLVAIGAVVGVIVNNKTNRLAIFEADGRAKHDRADARAREHEAWRKDVVLKSVAELLVLSNGVCQRIWRQDSWSVDDIAEVNDELTMQVSNGRTLLGRLFLVSNDLADHATRLIDALHKGLDEATAQRSGELGRQMTSEERGEAEASYEAAMDAVYEAEMNLMRAARSDLGIDLAPPVKTALVVCL